MSISVLILFWSYMKSRFHSAWMVAFVNSFVHIFVYGFFLASSLKLPFPWKNQLTVLQISQFIFDVLFAVPWILFKHNILSDGQCMQLVVLLK